MKRNKIYMMCMILAGILFFGSVGAIVRICMSYREGEQVYEELEEYIREPESTKEPEVEKSSEENSAFTFLQVDFESLQSINPEVIAWIQIPALDISYPVAKGTDNAYYENAVMWCISQLRKKLRNNPKRMPYIETVWGMGYKFNSGI